METLQLSILNPTVTNLSQQASHANLTHSRVNAKPRKTKGICGRKRIGLFAKFDRDGSCWKTSEDSYLPNVETSLSEYCGSFPRSGSMRNGRLYQHPIWEPAINENVSGLLPTPTTHPLGLKNFEPVDKQGNPVQTINQRWYDKRTGRLIQKSLDMVVMRPKLLPTPLARDWRGGTANRIYKRQSPNLNDFAAANLLPNGTHLPTAECKASLYLNPCFVEEMMGYEIGWTELKH